MNKLKKAGLNWIVVFGVVILILASASGAFAQAASSPVTVAPVPNPCPRFAPGSVVQEPPALYSQNGVLSVQFSYQTTTDSANRTLYCFMTPDGLENPTLHVNPGDHLIITVTNNTTNGALMMTIDPPNCGPGGNQMTKSSLNIHYHGTNTSPTCTQDEVIKTLINYGQTFQYNVAFPSNEPPGLYWYHPHVHGIAEGAVLGGASGAIVVDGIEDVQPAVSELPERILVLRDQPTVQSLQTPPVGEGSGGNPNGVPFQDLTVNNITTNTFTNTTTNVTSYTPAILTMEGDREFWRVSNSTSDTILDLQVQYDGVPQNIQLVAIDGVPINSQKDEAQPGGLAGVSDFRLPPASRVEFIVNGPSPSVQLAQLVTLNILTGQNGDDDPNRPIFNIQRENDENAAQKSSAGHRLPRFTALNPNQRRFAGLATAPIAVKRLVYFNEIQPTQFFMDVQGVPEKQFDPNAAPAITATQGTVEEWTVENHTVENHEFHFHQLHFLVESQNNYKINSDQETPAIIGQMLDMIEVPNWDGNTAHPFPSVTLRIDFRGSDIGDFVFHCHILNHEDLGMMNIIRVQRRSGPDDSSSENRGHSPQKAPASVPDVTKGPAKMPMK